MLVTVLRESFKKRKGLDSLSVGGCEYTVHALLQEYLHEASGGHAAGTKEAQLVTQDLDRRSIAAAITVEDGAHTVRHDKETKQSLAKRTGVAVILSHSRKASASVCP
jgi:hypothetical protein